jgi:hypothetical protein
MTQRFPTFTVSALSAALVFYFASLPLWSIYLSHRAAGDSKALYFAEYGIFIGAFLSGVVGAALGVVFAAVAHRRRERFLPLRALAFIANLVVVGYGLFVVFSSFRLR